MSVPRHLYHFPLCPFSRKIRILLREKQLSFELVTENVWERRPEFLKMNPAGDLPVLLEQEGILIKDHNAICEYLHEYYLEPNLLGKSIAQRAEVRRVMGWFDRKFYQEVSGPLLQEKYFKYFYFVSAEANSQAIRAAKSNLLLHLDYITHLIRERRCLAGENFSLADIAAVSHLSVLDYLGDIQWDDYPVAKDWYAIIKSRPSMRPILNDRIPGFIPPTHYVLLDF